MPLKLLKSQVDALPFDFVAEVEKFRLAKLAHRTSVGEPAPAAISQIVESAVKRVPGADGQPDDFVADYEIVDDTPPPPTLNQRKIALAARAQGVASSVIDGIIPPLKRRLWQLDYAKIGAKKAHASGGALSPAEQAFASDYEAKLQAVEAAHYHLATLESQIDDLTEETIAGWKGLDPAA